MSNQPVLALLGAGPRTGAPVAQKFANNGYKVALVSRSKPKFDLPQNSTHIVADFSDPDSLPKAFTEIREKVGTPSVVIYNAAAAHFTPASDPTSLSTSDILSDLNVNTISLYSAIKESISYDVKTFIYTGNYLNVAPMAKFISLGIGKAASAHLIASMDLVYREEKKMFYYVDERTSEGKAVGGNIDGEAHADMFWELVDGKKKDLGWNVTFVKEKGYIKFE